MRAASSRLFWIVSLVILAVACKGPPSRPRPAAIERLDPAARMRLAERIYREGILPSGEPLRGERAGGLDLVGREAACVMCHRRSGMGAVEGTRLVPPITGPILYQPRASTVADMDARHVRGPDWAHALGRRRAREPYTNQTLTRAIREGVDSVNASLDVLMPRYALGDEDAQLLVEYLEQLSTTPSPGITRDAVHLATVVAPGVAPVRKRAFLDVLGAFFDVKNSGSELEKRRDRPYSESVYTRYRAFRLHVWELRGAPETWGSQLASYYESQPVFALISGLSEGSWAPVQAFCERQGLPSWFPIVDLPEGAENEFYTTYFSAGALLEAKLLAQRLRDAPQAGEAKRVVQIRGDDPAAIGAAQALEKALARSGVAIEERAAREVDADALRGADAVVLWLRGREVAELADLMPPRGAIYVSATLGGGERAPLPAAWKSRARLLYPFELPDARRAGMARIRAWLAARGLPLVDERLQADAYVACSLLSEKIEEMREDLHRDYLLERAESILSMRKTNAMYHRLSLGPGQRFASKGGYIARFAAADGESLVADGEWIVPPEPR